jgi:hypothetical protein
VYQKPFVEFFASTVVVERLERAIGKVKGAVDFLAGNNAVRLELRSTSLSLILSFGRAELKPACRRLSGTR